MFERAYAQDAPKGRGAADLPRAPEHEQDGVAGAGLEKAERDHAQRRDKTVALSERLLLRSEPVLIEGREALRGGKRG